MLRMSQDGAVFAGSVPFYFHEGIELSRVNPAVGPQHGGSVITLIGRGFSRVPSAWCSFQGGDELPSKMVLARTVSDQLAECISPAFFLGTSLVKLSQNGVHPFSSLSLAYEFVTQAVVLGVVPTSGPTSGQSSIHVLVTGSSHQNANEESLRCRFGNKSVSAQRLGYATIECFLPPGPAGYVLVSVTSNAIDYAQGDVFFEYKELRLVSVIPATGPTAGGTIATITGMGLTSSHLHGTWCHFGLLIVPAIFVSPTQAACASPKVSTPQTVPLKLHIGGLVTTDAVKFNFVQSVTVTTAYPLMGPTSGGTTVTVDGLQFAALTWCRFHDFTVPAFFVSSTRVQCVTPPNSRVGKVDLSMSSNNLDFFGVQGLFEYIGSASAHTSYPVSGPTSGGTFVLVTGTLISERAAAYFYLHCSFNGTAVPGIFVDATQLSCYSPEMNAGMVTMAVSNNAQEYAAGPLYTYGHARLVLATPSQGPIDGNTRVHVVGRGLSPGNFHCQFDMLSTRGTFFSPSLVVCPSPRWMGKPKVATLRVINSEAQYTSVVMFAYVTPVHVLSIFPRHGPAMGATSVQVFGVGFASGDLECLFGSVAVIAHVQTPTRVVCSSPTDQLGSIVSLSVGRKDIPESSGLTQIYEFTDPLSLERVTPSHGPSAGGTQVSFRLFATSSYKLHESHCLFNGSQPIPAHVSDAYAVQCRAPSASRIGLVTAELTTNLVDCTDSGLTFDYQDLQVLGGNPLKGPVWGGTRVVIDASPFPGSAFSPWPSRTVDDGVWCDFGGLLTVASQPWAGQLHCITPAAVTSKLVNLKIHHFGAVLNGPSFQYFSEEFAVSSVSPVMGPEKGGTYLQVFGSAFPTSSPISCIFVRGACATCRLAVLATWHTRGILTCIAPSNVTGSVRIELMLGGQGFASGSATYHSHPDTRVDAVSPAQVPTEGGTRVAIHGDGFSYRAALLVLMVCRFSSKGGADVNAAATFETVSAVFCLTPTAAAGTTRVEVANNGHDFTDDGFHIEYVNVQLLRATPAYGPVKGGTRVLIEALRFIPGSYACGLGGTWTPARWASRHALECNTGPAEGSGASLLEVSHDNVTLKRVLSFSYVVAPRLLRMHPRTGPQLGATMLTISGQGFENHLDQYCRFSRPLGVASLVPTRWLSQEMLVCCAPISPGAGQVLVELSLSMVDYTSSRHAYTYTVPIEVHATQPAKGPGGSTVYVSAAGLLLGGTRLPDLSCRFNTTEAPAVLVIPGHLACKCPIYRDGVVGVRVSNNGDAYSNTAVLFEVQRPLLHSVFPLCGPQLGSTTVVITGVGMPKALVECIFDHGRATPATMHSPGHLSCLTPAMHAPEHIALLVGGTVYSAGQLFFTPYMEPARVAVEPAVGPLRGGTRVIVLGVGAALQNDACCMFGNRLKVPARRSSVDTLDCVSPSSVVPHASSLKVSLNGQQYSSSFGVFEFQASLFLESLTPGEGLSTGGLLAFIRGGVFSPRSSRLRVFQCRWNETSSAHTEALGRLVLACRTPPHPPGLVTAEVADNLQDFCETALLFKFNDVVLLSLTPSSGPQAGGTLVEFVGSPLPPAPGRLVCLFFETIFRSALCSSPRSCVCRSPKYSGPSTSISVRAWLRVQDSGSATIGQGTFTYESSVIISRVDPSVGPLRGGTRVVVHVSSLASGPPFLCRFGSTIVPAWRARYNILACVAPPFRALPGLDSVREQVRMDVLQGHLHSTVTVASFLYVASPRFNGAWPAYGPDGGGTIVNLAGGGVRHSGCRMWCRFGTSWVEASSGRHGIVQCVSPPASHGYVNLELSVNELEFTSSGVVFEFRRTAAVLLYPLTGPIGHPTSVTIHGRGFSPGAVACKVGNRLSVAATFKSASLVACLLPQVETAGVRSVQIVESHAPPSYGELYFHYLPEFELRSIYPTYVSAQKSTRIILRGRGFHRGAHLYVRLSLGTLLNRLIAANIVSSTLVECILPAVKTVAAVRVDVTINGQYFTSKQQVSYMREATIVSIDPSQGPVSGGGIVLVRGEDFSVRLAILAHLTCNFNRTRAIAEFKSAFEIWCVIPPHREGVVFVHGSREGGALSFAYHASRQGRYVSEFPAQAAFCRVGDAAVPAVVSAVKLSCSGALQTNIPLRDDISIWVAGALLQEQRCVCKDNDGLLQVHPRQGPTRGGTLVRLALSAHNRDGACSFSCMFGTKPVHATCLRPHPHRPMSRNWVECRSPPGAGKVSLHLLASGIQITAPAVFTYVAAVEIEKFSPVSGPTSGGIDVFVSLKASLPLFPSRIRCFFGLHEAGATVGRDHLIRCKAPARLPGPVILTVTSPWFTAHSGTSTFEYLRPNSYRMQPVHGPATGGTLVFFAMPTSAAVASRLSFACAFNSVAVPSSTLSVSHLVCLSPASNLNVNEVVSVELDGNHLLARGVVFTYYTEPLRVEIPGPIAGPSRGGTELKLFGLIGSMWTTCIFGTATTPIERHEGISYCLSPTSTGPRQLFGISIGRTDVLHTSHAAFMFHEHVVLHGVWPARGPVAGGSRLIITGGPFQRRASALQHLLCRIGLSVVHATYSGVNTLKCTSPSASTTSWELLEVSVNLLDFTASALTFEYTAHAVVRVSSPVGQVNVQKPLHLDVHPCAEHVACSFGKAEPVLPASRISARLWRCFPPRQKEATSVTVQVLADFAEAAHLRYDYHPVPELSSAAPLVHPRSSSSSIEVIGRNLAPAMAACSVGGARAAVQWYTYFRAQCVGSPASKPAAHKVSVTNDGQNFILSTLLIEYAPFVSLSSVEPVAGPVGSPAILMLRGRFLSLRAAKLQTIACSVNYTRESAIRIDEKAMRCLCAAPSTATGVVKLGVHIDGLNFSPLGILFEYYSSPRKLDVQPHFLQASSATPVEVRFSLSPHLACSIGGMAADITLLDAFKGYCSDSNVAGFISVERNLVRQDFMDLAPVLRILALEPTSGPRAGGRTVVVCGSGFQHASQLFCQFGRIAVPARVLSSERINCTTPVQMDETSVRLGIVGTESRSRPHALPLYHYDADSWVDSVQPQMGPSNGLTRVHVRGRRLPRQTACTFGFTGAGNTVWVSSSEVICWTPSMSPSSVQLSVRAHNAVLSAVTFNVYPAPKLVSMVPRHGPETGGTTVTIFATSIQDHMSCAFGASHPVPGTRRQQDSILCTSPPHPIGRVAVTLLDSQDKYRNPTILFHFEPICVIRSVTPSHGPVAGGTRLVVNVNVQSSQPMVYIGAHRLTGQGINASVVECKTPRSGPGAVTVRIGFVLGVICSGSVPFFYEEEPEVRVGPLFGPVHGGTIVRFHLSAPGYSPLWPVCCFGETLSLARQTGTSLDCIAPPAQAGVVSLSIAGADARHNFEYQAMATISSLVPPSGAAEGGTAVLVLGANFGEKSAKLGYAICRFNVTNVPATFLNRSALVCVSPVQRGTGLTPHLVPVRVSSNMQDISSGSLHFTYHGAAFISQIAPSQGPSTGGTTVTVSGANFVAGMLRCSFDGIIIYASVESSTRASCASPPHKSGPVPLGVAMDVQGPRGGTATFIYRSEMTVARVSPTSGPSHGGSILRIAVLNYDGNTELRCVIDEMSVRAQKISDTEVQCTTQAHSPGLVTVTVSADGVHATSLSRATFYFQRPADVHAVVPEMVPWQEGLVLRISGTSMSPGSACMLDGVMAARTAWVAEDEMICEFARGSRVGGYRLTIEDTQQDEPLSSSATLQMREMWSVVNLQPKAGPVRGGTMVRVAGEHFVAGPGLMCRFGDGAPVAARWISSVLLECTARPHPSGNATLDVTANGQDFTSSQLHFEYVAEMDVRVVVPHQGPAGGGTLVSLVVSRLPARAAALGDAYCRFDQSLARARLVSAERVECTSPPHAVGVVPLEISMNGLDFTEGSAVFAYRGPVIRSVHPLIGPESGGTLLTLTGEQFTSGLLVCNFAGAASTPALWVSAARIQCRTPRAPPGNVAFGLSPLRGGLVRSGQEFEFQARHLVRSISPDAGSVLGGTPVTVLGAHFSSRSAVLRYLRCRFNATVQRATWHNSSALVCLAPPSTAISDTLPISVTGRAILEVSTNTVDYTTDGVAYEYLTTARVAGVSPAGGPLSGGTLVTLYGNGFLPGRIRCRFCGSVVEGSYISGATARCLSPLHSGASLARGSASICLVSVSINSNEFSSFRSEFVYRDPVHVTSMAPASGPELGMTLISVRGRGFSGVGSPKCRFGATTVDAIYVTSGLINCTSPSHKPGSVSVEVSDDANSFSATNVTFLFRRTTTLYSVMPHVGPTLASTRVTVVGARLFHGSTCSVGGMAASSATWVSHTELICVIPARLAGVYNVHVVGSQGEVGSGTLVFSYSHPVHVARQHPQLGPVRGGTMVRVAGEHFVAGPGLMCRFGDGAPVAARWISSVLLECTARPHPSGNATLDVTANGQDFTSSQLHFEYVAEMDVRVVVPHQGPAGGGTLVSLVVSRLPARAAALGDAYCRFDQSLARARLVSAERVECTSPPHAVGVVPLEISMNGLDFTEGSAVFAYRGPVIRSVHPLIGPESGGTLLSIVVDRLDTPGQLSCVFGGLGVVTAQVLDASRLTCSTPRGLVGNVSLRLLLGHRQLSSHMVHFEYQPLIQVRSVMSVTSHALLLVRGVHFRDKPSLLCSVGGVLVRARFLNHSALLCSTPRHHHTSTVAVEVSSNGQDFSRSGILFMVRRPRVLHFWPSHGPTAGGTTVVLDTRFISSQEPLFCRFGSLEAPIRLLSPGMAQCVTPAHATALVSLSLVSLTLNERHVLSIGKYLFTEDLHVFHVYPPRVIVSSLRVAYIEGRRFVNSSSLHCAFGSTRTNASFIDTHTLACVIPYQAAVGAPVSVTTNGQDYSVTTARLVYDPCPAGAFCAGVHVLPCPPGASCDAARGSNFSLCPAGTYQRSAWRRTACRACPIGTFCPSRGQQHPWDCAPGMVCSQRGLKFPNSLCPPGHFCPPGVQTLDPTSSLIQRPMECPENTWCASGVVMNTSIAGNFSTPQPCLNGFVCFRGSDSPQGSGPCPTGSYCPPNMLPIICPPAMYCPGVGNLFPSLCTPGYYNDLEGQNACIECPIGHICPVAGLRRPWTCPAGSVCNTPGLRVPASLCPAGYYCWQGTETEDWNTETLHKPIPCPEATYCMGGITNNVTNEADYTSPQPCPHGQVRALPSIARWRACSYLACHLSPCHFLFAVLSRGLNDSVWHRAVPGWVLLPAGHFRSLSRACWVLLQGGGERHGGPVPAWNMGEVQSQEWHR